jgi:hypothetical protein
MTRAEDLTAPDELEHLLGKLTLHQKIRPLSEDGTFRTPAEPAIELRAMVFSDGPVGHSHPGQVDRPVPACAELLQAQLVGGRVLDRHVLVESRDATSAARSND